MRDSVQPSTAVVALNNCKCENNIVWRPTNLHKTTTMCMLKPASRQSLTLAREDSIAGDTLLLLGGVYIQWGWHQSARQKYRWKNTEARGRRNSEMLIKRKDEDVAADTPRQIFMSASVNKHPRFVKWKGWERWSFDEAKEEL